MSTRILTIAVFLATAQLPAAAADQYGQITFAGVPVPGATVTAMRGEQHITAVSDENGVYHFATLDDGVWIIRVEMVGFAIATKDVTITSDASPLTWELSLLPLEQIVALDSNERHEGPAGVSAANADAHPLSDGSAGD